MTLKRLFPLIRMVGVFFCPESPLSSLTPADLNAYKLPLIFWNISELWMETTKLTNEPRQFLTV